MKPRMLDFVKQAAMILYNFLGYTATKGTLGLPFEIYKLNLISVDNEIKFYSFSFFLNFSYISQFGLKYFSYFLSVCLTRLLWT